MLSWDLKCKNGIITKYTVAYFIVDDNSNKEILTTAKTELRIEKLVPGKTYEFQVKPSGYCVITSQFQQAVNDDGNGLMIAIE